MRPIDDTAPKHGLILGAAVWKTGPSPTLKRRAEHGAALFHAGKVDRLVTCGGLGNFSPTEAEAMAEILMANGVPAKAILLEDRSETTGENVSNALNLIGTRSVIMITDWYHAPRAKLIARRAGFNPVASSSPRVNGARIWPQVKGALREIPAYFAYFLRIKS